LYYRKPLLLYVSNGVREPTKELVAESSIRNIVIPSGGPKVTKLEVLLGGVA